MFVIRGGFSVIKKLLLALIKIFFPPACPLCGTTFPNDYSAVFCAECLDGFTSLPRAQCHRCALPFAGKFNSSHLCGRCIKKSPVFTKVYAVGLYESSLRHSIHQFKFSGKVGLDRPLGSLLEQAIASDLRVDLVVPVPLQQKRLQQRSYNQALLLAREVARIRRLPLKETLLAKIRETESQQGLSAGDRVKNLHGAFQLREKLSGQKILLIDDVMTTGATVAACSQVLIEGGAAEVYIAVIGRAA